MWTLIVVAFDFLPRVADEISELSFNVFTIIGRVAFVRLTSPFVLSRVLAFELANLTWRCSAVIFKSRQRHAVCQEPDCDTTITVGDLSPRIAARVR